MSSHVFSSINVYVMYCCVILCTLFIFILFIYCRLQYFVCQYHVVSCIIMHSYFLVRIRIQTLSRVLEFIVDTLLWSRVCVRWVGREDLCIFRFQPCNRFELSGFSVLFSNADFAAASKFVLVYFPENALLSIQSRSKRQESSTIKCLVV